MLRVQWVVQRVALFLLFVASGSSITTALGDVSSNECPDDSTAVESKAVCDQHAAEAGKSQSTNYDEDAYPRGCILYNRYSPHYYWNINHANVANEYVQRVCTATASSSASGDPHIKLAYGGSADFRGQNDSEYRIFAASTWHVDAKITEMTYMPFQGHRACGIKLINGTYFTKAILTVIGPDGVIRVGKIVPNWTGMQVTGDVEPSYRASRSARFDLPDGTELHFSQGWNHNKAAPGVPQHHLDIKLTASENTEMCGLIGSSFDGTGEPRFGPSDDYCVLNKNGVATTKAQGEGVYDHPMSDYEILAGVEMPCSMAWKKTHMAA